MARLQPSNKDSRRPYSVWAHLFALLYKAKFFLVVIFKATDDFSTAKTTHPEGLQGTENVRIKEMRPKGESFETGMTTTCIYICMYEWAKGGFFSISFETHPDDTRKILSIRVFESIAMLYRARAQRKRSWDTYRT